MPIDGVLGIDQLKFANNDVVQKMTQIFYNLNSNYIIEISFEKWLENSTEEPKDQVQVKIGVEMQD